MRTRPSSSGATTVLLAVGSATDRDLVRNGLTENAGLSLLGEATSVDHMKALILDRCPDVVVADLWLSDGCVLDTVAAVRAAGSPTRCLLRIAGPDRATVHRAVLAGVDGVISGPHTTTADLGATIRALHLGEQVFPAELLEAASSPVTQPTAAMRRPPGRPTATPTASPWSSLRRTLARGSGLVAAARPASNDR